MSAVLTYLLLVPPADSALGVPDCQTHQLRIQEVRSGGAGGSFLLHLSFKNTASATCRTSNIPYVWLIGGAGRVLGKALRLGHQRRFRELLVRPGTRIFEEIDYGENPLMTHTCPRVEAVRIEMPTSPQRSLVRLPNGSRYCGGWIEAKPLAATLAAAERGSG
jgi:Protein of unknown function (DUF4232)